MNWKASLKKYGLLSLPYLISLAVLLSLIGLFQLLRSNRSAMNWLADHLTSPIKQIGTALCDLVPFSVSEGVIYLLILLCFGFLVMLIVDPVRKKGRRLTILLSRGLAALCAGLAFYTAFVYLWGVNYYTDGFQEKSGIYAAPPTTEQLAQTTAWFAQKLNESGAQVRRNEQGLYNEDIQQVIADSQGLYNSIATEFPFLVGEDVRPKPFFFSEILSWINTTGFFFPWLGESNFNNHSPACDRPATIAHELAHQRAIASEQEANFIAVLVSTRSSSAAYRYSGYLLGYTYLNNALIKADESQWREIYDTLSPEVLADMETIREYWTHYDNLITQAANSVTDQRLKNYGQELGIQSYGAVVDLLVVYFGSQHG